jgi:hypothetical protein
MATAKRVKKDGADAGRLARFQSILELADRAATAARLSAERAVTTAADCREDFAREVCRDVLAGGREYLPWLRNYVIGGDLWDEFGRDVFVAAGGDLTRPDGIAGPWLAVFGELARRKGW